MAMIEMSGAWVRLDAVTSVQFINGDCYVACGHTTVVCGYDEGRKLLELLKVEGEAVNTDELTLDTIASIERGTTSNSSSPMWRCVTANGEKVNIFKHEDKDKDNFHLFEKKGWADVLMAMPMYEQIDTTTDSIAIAMKKDGKWWAIVSVMQAPSAIGEWFGNKANDSGLFIDGDYIPTNDDERESPLSLDLYGDDDDGEGEHEIFDEWVNSENDEEFKNDWLGGGDDDELEGEE